MTLGISHNATAGEVRQAYLKLAKKYHPDKNKSPDATTTMAEINRAYEILSDSQRRKRYDRENDILLESDAEVPVYTEEDEEIGQKTTKVFGKCAKCNFVNSSGMFVCSVCGYTFNPEAKNGKKVNQYYGNIDDISYEGLDNKEQNVEEDAMSEIIRCPQCNEINMYSRGSCWQCGLNFEIDEIA